MSFLIFRKILAVTSVILLLISFQNCTKQDFGEAENASMSDANTENVLVNTIPLVGSADDILERNAACPKSQDFIGPAAIPTSASEAIIGNSTGQGKGSIYYPETGRLSVVQLKFDYSPATLRVDNSVFLEELTQVGKGISVCIGTHGIGSSGLTQNEAKIITLVNRSASLVSIGDITQNSTPEIHLFGFAVSRITQLDSGSLLILYNSTVNTITQNKGNILSLNSNANVPTTIMQNLNTIELREGNVGTVTQNQGDILLHKGNVASIVQNLGNIEVESGNISSIEVNMGTIKVKGNINLVSGMTKDAVIEIDGGVINQLKGVTGTIILKNGAKIKNADATSSFKLVYQ